jgi:DnaJ family protein C protein 17
MAPALSPLEDAVDYYEFLSVESTANDAEIQRAYRRTNLKYHPDKFKPTPEISAEQAAVKLDLLQKILGVLKDPAQRADYDQKREAKRRVDAINRTMEANRKRMKVELDNRETMAASSVNGLKRQRSQADQEAERFARQNLGKKEEMEKQRYQEQTQRREAAAAQTPKEIPPEPEDKQRPVKITWAKEGEGLDIDEAALKEMCEGFGPVEVLMVRKDKKRRVNGQKTVLGSALVIFASLSAAQEAVKRAPWGGIESVSWVFTKDMDVG